MDALDLGMVAFSFLSGISCRATNFDVLGVTLLVYTGFWLLSVPRLCWYVATPEHVIIDLRATLGLRKLVIAIRTGDPWDPGYEILLRVWL